ncbi:MAG: TetR/AcrR family transcriptional regulator [Rhodospirillaceae bacterium]|nr:TetR/AcrR family transcriptional regulator [Rhodospirillaceae bacterium]
MAQVLKETVRKLIVDKAALVFASEGYHRATISAIATRAKVAVGTVYTYFPSKLHLLYAVYSPWLRARMDEIEAAAAKAPTPRAKVKTIILGLWRDTPAANPGLANSLMEALASTDPEKGKPEALLRWNEDRLAEMLAKVLPRSRRRFASDFVANILLMAYDGYVINRRLGDLRDYNRLADIMTDLLLGRSENAG